MPTDKTEKTKLNLNKIDIYLIVIGIFDAAIIASSLAYQWITQTELPIGFWSFATAVCGGEVVAGVIIKRLDTQTERLKIETTNELEMVRLGVDVDKIKGIEDENKDRGNHASSTR